MKGSYIYDDVTSTFTAQDKAIFNVHVGLCDVFIINIFSLYFSLLPMATIMPEVTDITGLDNYKLTSQTIFDANTGDLLKFFLVRLPNPVCLAFYPQ